MPQRKPRLADPPTKPQDYPCKTITVSALVMSLALEAAEGDRSRLRIIDEHTVMIVNPVHRNC